MSGTGCRVQSLPRCRTDRFGRGRRLGIHQRHVEERQLDLILLVLLDAEMFLGRKLADQ